MTSTTKNRPSSEKYIYWGWGGGGMGGAHKNNILRSFPMSYLYCKFYTNLHKKCKTYLFLFFILSLRHYYNVIFLYGIYTWRLFWGLLNLRTNFMCIRLLFRAEFMRTGSICPWFCELFCWAVCNNMFLLRKKKKKVNPFGPRTVFLLYVSS